MSITRRFTQLMKADVHGVLDLLEEPASIIRQSIREMTEEIEQVEAEQRKLNARSEENSRSREFSRSLLDELQQQVGLCIAEKNDELARKVIRRKLETERRLSLLTEQRSAIEQERNRLEQTLARYRAQLQQIQDRYELAQTAPEIACGDTSGISDADVEVALLKEKVNKGASI